MGLLRPAMDLWKWVEQNREAFRPPVGNKVIWDDSEFIAMVICGPNQRRDFHVDPHDEFFYQLKGDIWVETIGGDGKRQRNDVREGQVFLVPAFVPHSPRRPAGTWGLVIERKRTASEDEDLVWFCDRCDHELYRARMKVADIEVQLADAIRHFNASSDLRTCRKCGYITPEEVPLPQ
jgi:3-hydroxyanthranilate 3,4-dioxygenase